MTGSKKDKTTKQSSLCTEDRKKRMKKIERQNRGSCKGRACQKGGGLTGKGGLGWKGSSFFGKWVGLARNGESLAGKCVGFWDLVRKWMGCRTEMCERQWPQQAWYWNAMLQEFLSGRGLLRTALLLYCCYLALLTTLIYWCLMLNWTFNWVFLHLFVVKTKTVWIVLWDIFEKLNVLG